MLSKLKEKDHVVMRKHIANANQKEKKLEDKVR